jgi:hypothetical protein
MKTRDLYQPILLLALTLLAHDFVNEDIISVGSIRNSSASGYTLLIGPSRKGVGPGCPNVANRL